MGSQGVDKVERFRMAFPIVAVLIGAFFWHSVGYANSDLGMTLQYGSITHNSTAFINSPANLNSTKRGHSGRLALEWMPIQSPIGKIGVGMSTAIFRSATNSIPVTLTDGSSAASAATMTTVSLNGFLAYHAQFFPTQVIVPTARFGVGPTFAFQRGGTGVYRDDITTYDYRWGAGASVFFEWRR